MSKKSTWKFVPRFSLRWLLVFALLSSVVFGWFGSHYNRAKNEAQLLKEIAPLSPVATFDYQRVDPNATPPGPKFLLDWCGDNLFGSVESLIIKYQSFKIEDEPFEKIGGFNHLKNLYLTGTSELKDISVVGELDTLRKLNMSYCGYAHDLSPILKIRKLEKLNLSLNGFKDHSCIGEIDTLKELSIGHPYGGFQDWTWLSKLENLEKLYLTSSRINRLPPLDKLKRLTVLDLNYCSRLESSLPVADLENLEELTIGRGAPLQILERIEDLKKLQRLRLNPYKDDQLSNSQLEELKARIPNVTVSQY